MVKTAKIFITNKEKLPVDHIKKSETKRKANFYNNLL